MKVLLINGSPRRQGNTNVALEEVANQQKKLHGVETTDAPEREPWNPMNFI